MRENLCYKSKHLEKNNKGLSQLIVREKIFYNHFLQNQMDRMKISVHTHKDEYFHVFHVFFCTFFTSLHLLDNISYYLLCKLDLMIQKN